jgi:hypothetical protein
MLKGISAGIPDYSRDNDALVWERRLLACSSRQLAANLITENKLCSLPAVGAATSTGGSLCSPKLEIHLHVAFVLLRRARGVQRNLCHCIARLHEAILAQVLFDFFTANIGQHFAVNLNTG